MAENGIIGNVGASRRSVYGVAAMAMLMKLSGSEGKYVAGAMVLIFLLAVGYMILDEIKDRRRGKERE